MLPFSQVSRFLNYVQIPSLHLSWSALWWFSMNSRLKMCSEMARPPIYSHSAIIPCEIPGMILNYIMSQNKIQQRGTCFTFLHLMQKPKSLLLTFEQAKENLCNALLKNNQVSFPPLKLVVRGTRPSNSCTSEAFRSDQLLQPPDWLALSIEFKTCA